MDQILCKEGLIYVSIQQIRTKNISSANILQKHTDFAFFTVAWKKITKRKFVTNPIFIQILLYPFLRHKYFQKVGLFCTMPRRLGLSSINWGYQEVPPPYWNYLRLNFTFVNCSTVYLEKCGITQSVELIKVNSTKHSVQQLNKFETCLLWKHWRKFLFCFLLSVAVISCTIWNL